LSEEIRSHYFFPRNIEEAKLAIDTSCYSLYIGVPLHIIAGAHHLARSWGLEGGFALLFQKPEILLHFWDLAIFTGLLLLFQFSKSSALRMLFLVYFALFSFCSFFGHGAIPILGLPFSEGEELAKVRSWWLTIFLVILVLRALNCRQYLRDRGIYV